MLNLNSTAKEWICLLGCISSLAVSFFYRTQNDIAVYLTFAIIAIVALIDYQRRSTWPLLFLVVVVKLLVSPAEVFIASMHKDVWYAPFVFYLSSALFDLALIFCIAAYGRDSVLSRWFSVKNAQPLPQVFLISAVLAISAFYACAQACEWLVYFLDRSNGGHLPFLFGLELPFFYMLQNEVKLGLKLIFDMLLWSLLLEPKRWGFVQRLRGSSRD